MIRYISAPYLHRKKYDLCINMDRSALVYGYSWYLDTVCERWDALVLNDYDAVWPLPVRRKYGISYAYRPFGVQQLGPFGKKELTAEVLQAFVQALRDHFRFADIYLRESIPALSSGKGCVFSPQTNYLLRLKRSYEEIYQGIRPSQQRNLRKAEKQKLTLFENDSPEVLLDLFKNNLGQKLNLSPAFYRNIKKVMYQAIHRGMGRIWTVYGGPNQVCAGAFWLEHRQRSIFLFSGLNEWGRDWQAMPFLINEYLIFQAEKGEWLDFEGSNNPSLARFYQSFGSEPRIYQRLQLNRLPFPLNKLAPA